MPYIKRDAAGNIQAMSFLKTDECTELLNEETEVVKAISSFFSNQELETIASDLAMVRVIEDLIDILVKKSIISMNDLPQPVQLKLLKRKSLRTQGVFNINTDELINL